MHVLNPRNGTVPTNSKPTKNKDIPTGPRVDNNSQRHEEERQRGYGEYSRPGGDYRYSGERQGCDGDGAPTEATMSMDTTVSARNTATGGPTRAETIVNAKNTTAAGAHNRGGYEHGHDRERQEGYRGGEYGSSGGGYEGR